MSQERPNVFDKNPFADARPPEVRASEVGATRSQIALRRIIRTSDLSVLFQPIVRLATGDVVAYEALVRCAVPEYSSPVRLFDRAVRDQCVGLLGKTIREVAIPLCEGVPVFFNIHPIELEDRWLVRPDDPIYWHDEPVFLEITESVPFQQFDLCRGVLKEIRQRTDARLVVDDLGAGFSNLKYIADLEPAVVKLDRELCAGINTQPRLQRLVGWLVRLCQDLGAEVIAEGIETEEELAAVRDQGVPLVQGYFFARPGFPLPLAERVRRDARGRAMLSPGGGAPPASVARGRRTG